MIGSVEFEMGRLLETIRRVAPEMKKSGKALTKDAAKAAVRKAIEMTPPGHIDMDQTKAKERGEKKIAGDIRRVYATASYAYSTIKNSAAASAFWFRIKGRGKVKDFAEAMKIIVQESWNVRLKQAQIVQSPDAAIHQRMRVRGTIKRSQRVAQIVIQEGKINTLIKDVQKKVGIWASGWLPAVKELKLSRGVPRWIARHKNKAFGRCNLTETTDRFEIEIANSTGYGSLSRIVPYALAAARQGVEKGLREMKAKALANAGFRTPNSNFRKAA